MFPHEHFLLAWLPLVGYVVLRDRRLPSKQVVGAVLLGSLLPDLIDKPLAYQLNLIPHGRVFLHSLPVIMPLLIAVIVYGWKTGRLRMALAYSFGHLLHPVGDFYSTLLAGVVPQHLLWPFVSVPSGADPVWIHEWTIFSVAVLTGVALWLVADLRAQVFVHRLQPHSPQAAVDSHHDRPD
jgi:hypothetical protein